MTQLYHDKISDLFDEYYSAEKGAKPAPNKRIENADSLIEDYIEQHGKRPPASVLSRLATYIDLDYSTDSNPHKVSSEEFPVLSESQLKRRYNREIILTDVYTGKNDETIGRYTDIDGTKRRIYDYMTPKKDNALIPSKYLDLYTAIEKAGLTERQCEVLACLYVEGLTQEMTAERLCVSRRTVRTTTVDAISKIKASIPRH